MTIVKIKDKWCQISRSGSVVEYRGKKMEADSISSLNETIYQARLHSSKAHTASRISHSLALDLRNTGIEHLETLPAEMIRRGKLHKSLSHV